MIKKNIFIAPVCLELIFLQFEASEYVWIDQNVEFLFQKRSLTFSPAYQREQSKKPMDVGRKMRKTEFQLPSNMICRAAAG